MQKLALVAVVARFFATLLYRSVRRLRGNKGEGGGEQDRLREDPHGSIILDDA